MRTVMESASPGNRTGGRRARNGKTPTDNTLDDVRGKTPAGGRTPSVGCAEEAGGRKRRDRPGQGRHNRKTENQAQINTSEGAPLPQWKRSALTGYAFVIIARE